MIWNVCLILALAIFIILTIGGIIFYKCRKDHRRTNSLINLFLIVTFITIWVLMLPIGRDAVMENGEGPLKVMFAAVSSTFQVFTIDGDFASFNASINGLQGGWLQCYQIFGGILHVWAPVLLVSVVISFFKNVFGYTKLRRELFKNIYVFSELNDRSIVLAKSCVEHDRENHKKSLVVFTDVYNVEEEGPSELAEAAAELGALCLKNDILSLKVNFAKKRGNVKFFVIGEDESENINHTLVLMEKYSDCENAFLYSFMESCESDLLISSAMNMDSRLEVRRINEAQSVVYTYLYKNNLFQYAQILENGEKILSIVLVGMGWYGTELLKAFCWYGQVPGIRLEIHVFEQDAFAEQKFTSLCPEIMKLNHNTIEGECHYDIWFHRTADGRGMDVDTAEFDAAVSQLKNISIAYVALGDDGRNVKTAVKLRILLRRAMQQCHPAIETIVYASKKSEIVGRYAFRDFKGNDYDIRFMGDIRAAYSYDVIVKSELEEEAKKRHLKWVEKSSEEKKREETKRFYQYEYFRKSSISSVIRSKARREMKVPGMDKLPKDRTEEEKLAIQRVEHAGWNAYMRSEGYCYGEKRDDLAKLHPLLVPFDWLPETEKLKDDD